MAVKSSFKNMSLCLMVICLVCSALLAGVYALTKDPIENAAKTKNDLAIKEVLPETAVSVDQEKTIEYNGKSYTYNLAFDEQGNTVGCAVNVKPGGFGGPIAIKVGFTAEGVIWNTKVLSQAETPGLGAKCTDEDFSSQFVQLNPAEKKLALKKDGGELDAITASTITSRAYIGGLALAVEVFNAIVNTPMPLGSPDEMTCGDCESAGECETSEACGSCEGCHGCEDVESCK